MALYDYTKKPRSDGYRCYRVAVSVNGKLIQKCFPPGHYEEAQMWNDYLTRKHDHRAAGTAKRHSQQYSYRAKRYEPPRRSRVVGITIGFNAQKKCTPVRYYPCFFFNCHSKEKGMARTGSRCIKPGRDLQATWKECCDKLAEWRGYGKVPDGWYDACPTYDDFDALRKWYCKNGTNIKPSQLQIILTGERA